ncbi:Zn-dependent hydrolase [Methylobacterium sp. Leaf399]|uniref:Zn-dependent hydrolase n=1 Tax=Methylobacterium sp. Leaf399 TaxID=1736364 RepID=UPI0006F3972E|nr:Zn-dependent hydrolase [Methylobacterium sp. Leaf399]KQT07858.1 Zn-dependent hydrolase [Methylobacterium sp. Leaf399]
MHDARHNLKVDGSRLWATIQETARFGGTPEGGVDRLTLSATDGRVRDWFRDACEAAGLEVAVDELGTQFALRRGRDMSLPPVACGSHLDTQPTGGRFDGILGVLAGLEVMRTLDDAGIETQAPLMVVNWTNEEGSRFAPATMASAAYAGLFTAADIQSRRDAAGISVGEALDAIGYRGPEPTGARAIGAFVELHIEQGPILDAEGESIGVVDRCQGVAWYDGTVTGFESHAGTTPMPRRRDAMAGLAEIALAAEAVAIAHGPAAVATMGEATIAAPSRNVVPGRIAFTLDVRDPGQATLDAMEAALRERIAEIGARRTLAITLDKIWSRAPVVFHPEVVAAVEAATRGLGLAHRRMVSGAQHDACNIADTVPTAMIFVPCKDGISHNPAESATQEDCTAGADVLLRTLVALADAPRSQSASTVSGIGANTQSSAEPSS